MRFSCSAIKNLVFASIIGLMIIACDDSTSPTEYVSPEDLPKDTGGEHAAHILGSDASPYGHYIAVWHAINDLNPAVRAKLTMYPGVEHDSWTKTYNSTGMGTEDKNYDVYNEDIYTWMLGYSK